MLNLDSKTAALVLCVILNVGGRGHREFVRVLRSPAMESIVAESGSLIVASTPEEFAAFLHAEQKRMQELVQRTGAKLD